MLQILFDHMRPARLNKFIVEDAAQARGLGHRPLPILPPRATKPGGNGTLGEALKIDRDIEFQPRRRCRIRQISRGDFQKRRGTRINWSRRDDHPKCRPLTLRQAKL